MRGAAKRLLFLPAAGFVRRGQHTFS